MKNTLLIMAALLLSLAAKSQKWADMMNDPNSNYYDVVREATLYFETHDKGRGSGWKQFKRWEYEMQFQIDSKGRRLDGRAFWNTLESVENLKTGPVSNWVELGPKVWNRTSSWNPGVGRVTCIAVNPANQNEIYVGSPGGGVWKTTNGGSTWSVLTDNLTVMNIFSITIDPSNSSIIYVGSQGGGVLKSTNGGSTFAAATTGIPTSATVNRILVNPSNTSIVIAATSSGMYRSTNGGTSWTQASTGSFNDAEFKPGDPSIVYACGTSFYKSTDNGQTYTVITAGISTSGRSFVSVTPANANYVYYIQASGSQFGYLYRSTNSGTSFTTQVTGSTASCTNYFSYDANGCSSGGQAWYDMAMCVSPTNADEVYIGGILIWKSTNGGTSFTSLTEWFYPNSKGYTHCDMHALEYIGSTLYTGSDGGIYQSTDGGNNFTDLSTGLGIRQFYRIGGSKTVPAQVAGGAQDNGSSILKTTGWIDWLGADGMETFIDHTNANIIYGTSQNGVLYRSSDGGNSRTNLSTPPGSGPWVTQFVNDPVTPTTLYVGYNEVFRSTNSGSSWTQISGFAGGSITAIAVAPSDPNTIYAANGSNLFVTKNGGSTWTNITTGLSGTIYYVTVHESSPDKVAVTTSGGTGRVFKSSNGGTSWTNISGTLPALTGKSIVYHDGGEEGLFVCLSVGVYYRDNSMSDWVPFMTNLPKVQLSELEIHQGAGKIRVATYGRGLWESDLPCTSPGALTATNITVTTATLNWGTVPGSPTYNVKWRQVGSGTWLGSTTTSATTLNISGLSSATQYEFTVSTNCSGGTTVDAPLKKFTTNSTCTVPSGLTAASITGTTAVLGWIHQPTALSYNVIWRPVGTTTWVGNVTTTVNSYTASGLSPSTTYEFTVRSQCSGGWTAYTTPYKTFTTSNVVLLPDLTIQYPSFTLGVTTNFAISDDISTVDLEVDTIPRVVAGEPIDMHCYVRNIGQANATGNYTGFYLSKSTNIRYDSDYLGYYYLSSLQQNYSRSITKRCTIPLDAQLGIQYLLYQADDGGYITESNETNNIAWIRVYVIGSPQFTISRIPGSAADEQPEAGSSKLLPLVAFPNPTTGAIQLHFGVEQEGMVSLFIYDHLGRRVGGFDNRYYPAGMHGWDSQLDGAAGVYTVKLVSSSRSEMIRLIKE